MIVMQQVTGHTYTLGHPVEPNASIAMMNVIAADQHINWSMDFVPSHFRTGEQAAEVDMMYFIVGDGG